MALVRLDGLRFSSRLASDASLLLWMQVTEGDALRPIGWFRVLARGDGEVLVGGRGPAGVVPPVVGGGDLVEQPSRSELVGSYSQ